MYQSYNQPYSHDCASSRNPLWYIFSCLPCCVVQNTIWVSIILMPDCKVTWQGDGCESSHSQDPIHASFPSQCMEYYYPSNIVLHLKFEEDFLWVEARSILFILIFWLLIVTKHGCPRFNANPCLYYKWTACGFLLLMSWVNTVS